jgi:hypothetical protein
MNCKICAVAVARVTLSRSVKERYTISPATQLNIFLSVEDRSLVILTAKHYIAMIYSEVTMTITFVTSMLRSAKLQLNQGTSQ